MNKNNIIEIGHGDRQLVSSFLDFTKTVFSWSNFSEWYSHGFWPAEYIPHSIIIDGKIASNVSITKMEQIARFKSMMKISMNLPNGVLQSIK